MDEGLFTPLTSNDGNTNGEIARLRDIFLNAEMDYFRELLEVKENREYLESLLSYPPDELFKEATKRIDMIENGMVSEENLDYIEAEITFFLAAIQDKAKIKELIRTMSEDEFVMDL